MKYLSAFLITSLLSCLSSQGTAQTVWKTFNHENGFTIQLPNYFSKGLLVAAGTLQYFDNKIDDSISLSVESFGHGNSAELQSTYENDLTTYKGISYKVIKPNWYVISGQNEEGIFYNKSIIRNGVQHHLRITYPVHEKALFDAILPRLSSSFGPG